MRDQWGHLLKLQPTVILGCISFTTIKKLSNWEGMYYTAFCVKLCLWSQLERSVQFWPPHLKNDVAEKGGLGKG